MNRAIIVLLAMCMFAAAMVPKNRRAFNPEEEKINVFSSKSSVNESLICAETTPCGWSVYKPKSKMIEINITNTYCICPSHKACTEVEDDSKISVYIYRCGEPNRS